MPRLPGAAEEIVKHETFAALRELCEDGYAWVETIGPLSAGKDNPNIYLDPQFQNTRVGYILWADIPSAFHGYMLEDPGHIVLTPTPEKDYSAKFKFAVTLVPMEERTQFPDYFWSHWRDAVIDGVCYRMMTMPSKPYTDKAMGLMHGRKFRNHVKRCRTIAKSRFSNTANWRYPSFAVQSRGPFA